MQVLSKALMSGAIGRVPLFHFVLYAPAGALHPFLALPAPSFLSFAPAPYDPLGGCLVALAPLPSLPGPLVPSGGLGLVVVLIVF